MHPHLLWGGAGQADAVIAACRPWREVEHLIMYNTNTENPEEAAAMKAEGCRVLGAIPGVRQVVVGTSLREDAPYRHFWAVRFAQPAVVESYRDHPDHQRFANSLFRPLAADRITIDFQHVLD